MDWFSGVVVLTVVAVLVLLATNKFSPLTILLGALGVLVLANSERFTPGMALSGFGNEGMITIAVLYVVGAGVRETGAIGFLAAKVLGQPKTHAAAQARLILPVAGMSAFVNNTPLVAVLLPVVEDWCRKTRIPASKLLMPLSFAAVLGGLGTLIGTSTNLLVAGQLKAATGHQLGFFDITWVGLPCMAVGILYMLAIGGRMLPERKPPMVQVQNPKEYTIEMSVDPKSPLVGKTIEAAGLRHLPGVYLMEIGRQGETIPSVGPQERLQANDQLVFVGVTDSVVDLQRFAGLKPATDQVFKLEGKRDGRTLGEAVVSHTSPLNGMSIREGRFRTHYGAAVVAVARNGERVRGKIGDIVMQPGDTLLVEAPPAFFERYRDSRDFYLVSRIDGYVPPKHDRAWISLTIMGLMIAAAGFELLSMLQASLLAAGAMLLTRCVTMESARRSMDVDVLLCIAAALGLGKALEVSGAAEYAVSRMMGVIDSPMLAAIGIGPAMAALIVIYFAAMVASELLTNNAAAALLLPFGLATAKTLDVSFMPYVIAVMIAASAAFATPIGYQTHLMVFGPGGYKFSDFVKAGVPMDLLMFAVAMVAIPLAFPF